MKNNITLRAQQTLNVMGFDAGPNDGIFGRETSKGVTAFQKAKKLRVTGTLDPETVAVLLGEEFDMPPWMIEIERVRGLHEVRHRSLLMRWLASDGATLGDPAKNPWCGDAVQTPLLLTLPNEPVPTNPYLAANWTKFGQPCTPQLGAVLVFWRGSPTSWKGHVTFYIGEDATHYICLGGNQSNMIRYSRIAKNRLRENGCRWPLSYSGPTGGPRFIANSKQYVETVNEA
tara:strand:+ start:13480 stop:14169 length:690 start_codon:yes stop_codon:yes gene_type:complete